MAQAAPGRGTQSFVHTLSASWQRPSLTALEVLWRWLYGVPALALVIWRVRHVLGLATQGTFDVARLGLDSVLLSDPVGALSANPTGTVTKFVAALMQLRQEMTLADWAVVPVLAVLWVVVSAVGRSAVLRRADPAAHARVGTLMVLQALRTALLATLLGLWYWLVLQFGALAVTGPLARNEDPNLVLYCGLVIVLSLGMFTAWAFSNWVFSIAPMLAQIRDLDAGASLRGALQLGPLRGKLVEINLVLGIVKIALVILAMVFSATPLPFQSVTSTGFLVCWWSGVTLLYLLWSDFFHVARMVGYLSLWRTHVQG